MKEHTLPTIDRNGFEFVNAVELNAAHPDSFWIPDEDRRTTLEAGDIVKLVFAFGPEEGTERMWVKVTGRSGELYEGEVNNFPVSDRVAVEERVVFGAEHVIDVSDE